MGRYSAASSPRGGGALASPKPQPGAVGPDGSRAGAGAFARAGGDAKPSLANLATAPSAATAIQTDLLQALREPNLTERALRIAEVMRKMSAENWRGLLAAFAEEKQLGREHGDVRLLLAQRAGEVVGVDAVRHFLGSDDPEATRAALTGWAIKNPTIKSAALDQTRSIGNPKG